MCFIALPPPATYNFNTVPFEAENITSVLEHTYQCYTFVQKNDLQFRCDSFPKYFLCMLCIHSDNRSASMKGPVVYFEASRMLSLQSIFVCLFILVTAPWLVSSECPNACSGHGDCSAFDACRCYKDWMASDCSQRELIAIGISMNCFIYCIFMLSTFRCMSLWPCHRRCSERKFGYVSLSAR
jgi:hypothetical protein